MYLLVCVYIPPFETFYGFFVGYIMHALRKLFVHFLGRTRLGVCAAD